MRFLLAMFFLAISVSTLTADVLPPGHAPVSHKLEFESSQLLKDTVLVGLGFSALSRRTMIAGGIFCAVVSFFLTAACEWNNSPFDSDQSFTYFLANIHNVDSQMTLVMIGLGVLMAFWFGRGR